MSEQDTTPKTPEEVLEHVKDLERKHQQKGVHLARLKMWAEVALQGLTPDQVRGFSWKEADLKDSYQSWLRTRKKVATAAFMGRATTFGMGGPPGDNAPPWVHHVRKTRDGRFEGNVYTVAVLKDGTEVRLDPPIIVPPDFDDE